MKRISAFTLAVVLFSPFPARADNGYQSQPAPESAEKLVTSFDQGLEGAATEPTAWDQILSKSTLKLKLRNYYLSRPRPEKDDPKAWAQGGSMLYNIDQLGGFLGLTAEYFGSFKLYGPPEHDGTLLLGPGQNNIDTLGVLNPRLTWEGNVVSAYRQRYDLPYVNSQENRMIPNTFEGYTIGMPRSENETFQYVVGYIAAIKTRNAESFKSMSEAVADTEKERGMIASGARYYIVPELSVAAINYFVEDTLNVSYGEAVHKAKLNDDVANTFSAQVSDQRSVGDDLVRNEKYSTGFWGVQDAVSYQNFTLKAAFSMNDSGGIVRAPWGSHPSYNSAMFEDFNRANEKAWQVGISYNFGRFGLKGLGVTAAHIYGLDAIDETTKEIIPDKNETDVTLDYKILEGMLTGLWFRLRSGFINEDGLGTTQDYRIIVNYEIPILAPDAKS